MVLRSPCGGGGGGHNRLVRETLEPEVSAPEHPVPERLKGLGGDVEAPCLPPLPLPDDEFPGVEVEDLRSRAVTLHPLPVEEGQPPRPRSSGSRGPPNAGRFADHRG